MAQMLTRTEIDALVAERDHHRAVMDYAKSDEIKTYLAGMGVEIYDISYKCEGNSKWTYTNEVVSSVETNLMTLAHEAYHSLSTGSATENDIVTQAMEFLKLQSYGIESSKEGAAFDEDVCAGAARTVVYKSSEMNGRKYVDAAFEFCMAGVSDPVLFTTLADFARNELVRFGSKNSCKALPILQMMEKLAVSGVRDHDIFSVAKELLKKKGNQENMHGMEDSTGGYNLFSRRPLLWLWRYATKQKKPTKKSAPKEVETHEESTDGVMHTGEKQAVDVQPLPAFAELFADSSLPLVLDLGCGYGVPLLNLCDQQQRGLFARRNNYLGVDLSDRAIRYASGISKRWGFAGTCAFVYADCQAALAHIHSTYPGPVVLAMVNFPTPYGVNSVLENNIGELPADASSVTSAEKRKFSDTDQANEPDLAQGDCIPQSEEQAKLGGNTQLPDSFDNFMVNQGMVRSIVEVLSQRALHSVAPVLFLQSNVEDVTVTMRNIVHSVLSTGNHANKMMTAADSEISDVQAAIDQIFPPATARLADPVVALKWRTLEELQRATSGAPGTGRMSRRLQLWLNALEQMPGESTTVRGEVGLDRDPGVAARRRAAGHGWLAGTPLPGNARTETEVHCDIEKQPVHRTVFVLK